MKFGMLHVRDNEILLRKVAHLRGNIGYSFLATVTNRWKPKQSYKTLLCQWCPTTALYGFLYSLRNLAANYRKNKLFVWF